MPTAFRLDKPKPSTVPPIKAEEVTPRQLLPETGPQKFYKTVFQVGPYKGGRAPGSNQFVRKPADVAGEPDRFYPVYRVYEQILTTGGVNGKINNQNDWLQANQRRNKDVGEGRIGHMTAVLSVEELKDYVPPSTTFVNVPVEMLNLVIDARMAANQAASNKRGGQPSAGQ